MENRCGLILYTGCLNRIQHKAPRGYFVEGLSKKLCSFLSRMNGQ